VHLNRRGIDDGQAWSEPRESREVSDVERQELCDVVDVTDSHQSGVVNLLAHHAKGSHQGFPSRIDGRRLGEQRKLPFECRRLGFSFYNRQT